MAAACDADVFGLRPNTATAVRVVVVASAAMSFLLAVPGMGRSFGYDEGVTVRGFVNVPFGRPFTDQIVANNHPVFSFLEQLVWKAGGTSEAAMRLLPALFGSTTVGLVAWWCGRRWGPWPALAGAAVLGTSPLFVTATREARGYSLMTLVAVVTTILVVRSLEAPEGEAEPTWLGPVYVALAASGLGTHLYAGLALAAHAGLVVARGRLSWVWVRRWAGSVVLAGLVYLETFPMRREGTFDLGFPVRAAQELLGGHALAVAVLGVVSVLGVAALRRDALAVAVPLCLVAVVWCVVQPFDLYPRFLVVLLPGVAVAAAWVVAQRPVMLVPLALAAVVAVPPTAPDSGARDAAAHIEERVAEGGRACAVGAEYLIVYTQVVEYHPDVGCDVIAIAGSEPEGMAAERATRRVELDTGSIEVLGPPTG